MCNLSKNRANSCIKKQVQGKTHAVYSKGALFLKDYKAKNIRNVVFAGHASAGKTSLVEAAYYLTGKSDRLGTIAEGNTISDFDSEEIRRKSSISASVVPCEWTDVKLNMIDTPGYFDFVGEVKEGLRAADSALIVLSGRSGVSVGTEQAFKFAKLKGVPTMFFVNKIDDNRADYQKTLEEMNQALRPSEVAVEETDAKDLEETAAN